MKKFVIVNQDDPTKFYHGHRHQFYPQHTGAYTTYSPISRAHAKARQLTEEHGHRVSVVEHETAIKDACK